jgi:hypothetical protein
MCKLKQRADLKRAKKATQKIRVTGVKIEKQQKQAEKPNNIGDQYLNQWAQLWPIPINLKSTKILLARKIE